MFDRRQGWSWIGSPVPHSGTHPTNPTNQSQISMKRDRNATLSIYNAQIPRIMCEGPAISTVHSWDRNGTLRNNTCTSSCNQWNELQHQHTRMDSRLEAFSCDPADSGFGVLASQLTTFTTNPTEVFLSYWLQSLLQPVSRYWRVNNPTLWDFCISTIGRPLFSQQKHTINDIEIPCRYHSHKSAQKEINSLYNNKLNEILPLFFSQ